jgi:hypothetical protein
MLLLRNERLPADCQVRPTPSTGPTGYLQKTAELNEQDGEHQVQLLPRGSDPSNPGQWEETPLDRLRRFLPIRLEEHVRRGDKFQPRGWKQ